MNDAEIRERCREVVDNQLAAYCYDAAFIDAIESLYHEAMAEGLKRAI